MSEIAAGRVFAFRMPRPAKRVMTAPAAPPPHTITEDIHALLLACSFIVFGIICLKRAGLITGGIAGIALCCSYITHLPVQVLLIALNVPFVIFARIVFGWDFAIKTTIVNALVFVMTAAASHAFQLGAINPLFAAIFGGTLIGMGILALARHKASIGGVGVLALYFQDRLGWSAGRTLMLCDAVIFIAALTFLPPDKLALSFVSDVAMNLVLVIYHRPGRYVAA